MNTKGQSTTLRTFILGFIIISFIFVILGATLNNYMADNDITPDSNLSKIYDDFNETLYVSSYVFGDELQNKTKTGGEGLSSIGGEASVLKSMYKVIKIPFSLLSSMTTLLTTVSSLLDIPPFIFNPLLGIIMVVLSAIILAIIFRSSAA